MSPTSVFWFDFGEKNPLNQNNKPNQSKQANKIAPTVQLLVQLIF